MPIGDNISGKQVLTPGITFPVNNDIVSQNDLIITSTVFQSVGDDIHESSDWQIATDAEFTSVIFESLNDAANKESIDLSNLDLQTDGTIYYARVKHNGFYDSDESWSSIVNFLILSETGETTYTTAGTYYWTCPVGVTSVSVVCIGGGGSGCSTPDDIDGSGSAGSGGGLGWKNNISVTPGQIYLVIVGSGGGIVTSNSDGYDGGISYFISSGYVYGGGGYKGIVDGTTLIEGGSYTGDGGGTGGAGGYSGDCGAGGGGCGGYSGAGGEGASSTASNGSDGAGGGGGGGANGDGSVEQCGAGGGGVGLFGQGVNGAGGIYSSTLYMSTGGSGGSDGFNGGNSGQGGNSSSGGGSYGGGGGIYAAEGNGIGADGAVRIIWGSGRTFPSNAE